MIGRYATPAMEGVFSDQNRYSTWRKLWVALAEVQASMGASIPLSVIEGLRAEVDNIDWVRVRELEAVTRHDVQAHLMAFEGQVPGAEGVLHRGATSAFVVDNTDLILQRAALDVISDEVVGMLSVLEWFAQRWKSQPVVGRTHLQPASLVTVGLRATRWAADLVEDRNLLDYWRSRIRGRGCRGTVGTAATFREMFGDTGAAVMESRVMEQFGFDGVFPMVSQTYPRKLDTGIGSVLSSIVTTANRAATDLRLMAAFGEFREPFGDSQVGSSAMPHKRNPIMAERIGALSRRVRSGVGGLGETENSQWLERTLDDSAYRRLTIPEIFHLTHRVLILWRSILEGGEVLVEGIEEEIRRHRGAMMMESALLRSDTRNVRYRELQGIMKELPEEEWPDRIGAADLTVGRAVELVEDFWRNEKL